MYERRGYKAQKRESEIDKEIKKIEKLNNLGELRIKDFAEEGGEADRIAKELKTLKSSQLRKFYDGAKELETRLAKNSWSEIEEEFYLLQPRLAYAKARGVIPKSFYRLLTACMKKVNIGNDTQKKENYERLMQFFEAIVAYHRYHYPRER